MVIALTLACLVVSICVGLVCVGMAKKLDSIRDELAQLRRRNETEGIPLRTGRSVPSVAELQAARNRMDQFGVAHPGSHDG